eukprot:7211475-Heterocapsa_arctica.AAC.1
MALSDGIKQRILQARQASLRLVVMLGDALNQLRRAGVSVALAFEWPRGADGWAESDVKKVMEHMPLQCDFDG